jgi:hypothetical protein
MARRPSLSEAELPAVPAFAPAPTKRQEAARTPARQGKRGVAFWLTPEAFKQLRGMTFEEDRSVQSLMEEATDMLFQSRGKHRLAQAPEPRPAPREVPPA